MNRQNSKEETPLYLAAKNGNLDVVKFLVKRHANMNLTSKVLIICTEVHFIKRGNEKRTPLEIAIRWK
jgi:ankyrin repeat protein